VNGHQVRRLGRCDELREWAVISLPMALAPAARRSGVASCGLDAPRFGLSAKSGITAIGLRGVA